jgi:hypothetical protein
MRLLLGGAYAVVALVSTGLTVLAIVRLRRTGASGWFTGGLAGILFAMLFMIKFRCSVAAYSCWFMSFTGGFTWHVVPGLVAFSAGWIAVSGLLNRSRPLTLWAWMERVGRSLTPLLGLGIVAVWEVLPVALIHPPSHGGVCPDLPIICHDTPLLGRGGLLYWSVPFVLWAVCTLAADVTRALKEGPTHDRRRA